MAVIRALGKMGRVGEKTAPNIQRPFLLSSSFIVFGSFRNE